MDTKHVKHLVNVLLLIWSVQTAFCKICGSDFEDIRSRAILSDLIVEGTVDIKYENRDNPRYNVSVLVSKILKGSLNSNTRRRVLESIRIGEFGPFDKDQCLIGVTEGLKYIFFLRPTGDKNYYKHASLPVESSKKTLRQIRGILCKNCAKPPKIKPIEDIIIEEGESVRIKCRVKGYPKPLISWAKNGKVLKKRKGISIRNTRRGSTVRIRKLRIRDAGNYACIARNALQLTREEMFLAVMPWTRHTSPPNISSTIEPTHLMTTASKATSKPISITSLIRSSTSRPSFTAATTSKYSTVESILNGNDSPSTSTTEVPVTSSTTASLPLTTSDVPSSQIAPTGHYYPCEKQTYCLNGGTCVYLPAFKAQFCRCPPDFTGERCETKDLFILLREIKMAEHQHQDRVITILGIVIGLLVLIGIFIGAYCKARKRRKAFREGQELRKRLRELESNNEAKQFPNPTIGKKSGSSKPSIKRSNSTTQTDAFNIKELFPTMPNGMDTGLDTTNTIQNGIGGMRPRLQGVSSTPQCVRVERHDNPQKVAPGESDGGSKGSTPSQSSQTESAMQSWPPSAHRGESNSKPDNFVENDLNQSDYENLDNGSDLEHKLSVVPPYMSLDSHDSYTGPRHLQSTKRSSGGTNNKSDDKVKINSQRKYTGLSSDSGSDLEDTSSSGASPECEESLHKMHNAALPNRWKNSNNSAGNLNWDRYGNSLTAGLTGNSCAFSPYDVNVDEMDNRYPHRQNPHYKLLNDKEQRQRLLRTQNDHDATRL